VIERQGGDSKNIEICAEVLRDMNSQPGSSGVLNKHTSHTISTLTFPPRPRTLTLLDVLANSITYATFCLPFIRLIEKNDNAAFDKYLSLMFTVQPRLETWVKKD
jgi:hypothetical protein